MDRSRAVSKRNSSNHMKINLFPGVMTPRGGALTWGEFVRDWRRVQSLPPRTEVGGWEWYPVSREHVLRDISHGIHDRINQRGGLRLNWRANDDRIQAQLRRTVKCECRWCGTPIPYQLHQNRFCEASCRRSYHGF